MKKTPVFGVLFLFYGAARACGSDVQQQIMTRRLYADADVRQFVCAGDLCQLDEFEKRLQFHQYDESFHGGHVSVCLVEPALSITNSYTAVFASNGDEFEFRFVSYGTGFKVGINKTGGPMISECSVSDPDNQDC